MPTSDDSDLTAAERALLADPGDLRGGYAPRDGVAEPDQAPTDPASPAGPPPAEAG
jgi:hypothetical protein